MDQRLLSTIFILHISHKFTHCEVWSCGFILLTLLNYIFTSISIWLACAVQLFLDDLKYLGPYSTKTHSCLYCSASNVCIFFGPLDWKMLQKLKNEGNDPFSGLLLENVPRLKAHYLFPHGPIFWIVILWALAYFQLLSITNKLGH